MTVEAPGVDVIVAEAPADPDALASLADLLDESERARAANYRSDDARCVFTLARGLLRREAGARLGAPPGSVRFRLLPSGKPELEHSAPDARRLRFSVSHTGRFAALAFAWDVGVGLDIEGSSRAVQPLQIASRYFHEDEMRALTSLPAERRVLSFLAGWTRKEAIVKARGSTMAESLTSLAVDLNPEAVHPAAKDDVPGRAACALTTLRFDSIPLIGAVAVTGEHPANVTLRVLSAPAFD